MSFARKAQRRKLVAIARKARKARTKDQPKLPLRSAMHGVQQAAALTQAHLRRAP